MADTSVIFNVLAKDNASGVLGKVGGAAKSLFMGLSAFAAVDFFKGAFGEADEAAQMMRQTEAVLKSTGAAAGVTGEHVADLAGKLSLLSGVDDEVIQSGQNVMLTFTGVKNRVGAGNDVFDQATLAALNMSRALGTDMQGATIQVGKALNDPVKGLTALAKVGVSFTKGQKDQIKNMVKHGDTMGAQKVILAELNKEFGGSAAAMATPADKAKVAWGNFKEEIGTRLMPTAEKVLGFLIKTLDWVGQHGDVLKPLAIGVGILAAGIWLVTAAQIAWNVAMALNPIGLIVIAVIAVVGAIVYLWFHSAAFRNFFIGVWDAIWGFLKGVGHWFAGPFAGFFVHGYQVVQHAAGVAVAWVHDKWSGFINFFTGLPGKIRSIAAGMWDGIKNAFRGVINWIIGAWNRLHFRLPSFDTHIPGIGVVGGFNVGMPQLPLMAGGGDILRGGIAVVHAGERVLPAAQTQALPPGSGGGGTTTVRFAGNLDSAFATAFMLLIRNGMIRIEST